MLVKNSQISNTDVIDAINVLAAAKIPVRAGFVLAQNLKLISGLSETYDAQRIKLVKQYAQKDEKGELVFSDEGRTQIKIADENQSAFAKEFNELLAIETELDIKKIKLSDIGAVEITTGQLSQLLWMIDEA